MYRCSSLLILHVFILSHNLIISVVIDIYSSYQALCNNYSMLTKNYTVLHVCKVLCSAETFLGKPLIHSRMF